jgi:hypothetical protein
LSYIGRKREIIAPLYTKGTMIMLICFKYTNQQEQEIICIFKVYVSVSPQDELQKTLPVSHKVIGDTT